LRLLSPPFIQNDPKILRHLEQSLVLHVDALDASRVFDGPLQPRTSPPALEIRTCMERPPRLIHGRTVDQTDGQIHDRVHVQGLEMNFGVQEFRGFVHRRRKQTVPSDDRDWRCRMTWI
jgi:hypothetical protein